MSTPMVEFTPDNRYLFFYSRDGKKHHFSEAPRCWEIEVREGLTWMSIFWTKDPQWWAPT